MSAKRFCDLAVPVLLIILVFITLLSLILKPQPTATVEFPTIQATQTSAAAEWSVQLTAIAEQEK